MYLAYVDDAGDPGLHRSPSRHFVLAAVVVHEKAWNLALDGLIELRVRLRARYRVSSRLRIKTHDFIRGTGPFRGLGLSERRRKRMLQGVFHYQARTLPLRVFAVAINKERARARGWEDPAQAAWTFLFQRLHRFAEQKDERTLLITEAELALRTRRLVRQLRRHHRIPNFRGHGDRRIDLRRLVEDPLAASADESYWLQLADWNAYAALRSQHVEPRKEWVGQLWDSLGVQRLEEVSRLRGGPSGIVLYPE